jgi:hypothetical protein
MKTIVECVNESKKRKLLPLSYIIRRFTQSHPKMQQVVDFVASNYDEITLTAWSGAHDNITFPSEINNIIKHYGFNYKDFSLMYYNTITMQL